MARKLDTLYDSSGTLKSYSPTLRENLVNLAREYWPFNDREQKAQDLMALTDWSPVGTAEDTYDAGRELAGGNPMRAGLLAMAAIAPGAIKKGIRAFHGSPHSFENFSLDKIGTGEGAKSYGHGLYFAENEGTALDYKRALAQQIDVNGQPLLASNKMIGTTGDRAVDDFLVYHDGDIEAAIAEATEKAKTGGMVTRPSHYQEMLPKLLALRGKVNASNTGHVYEVNINADPEQFLDWDKPLSAQSPSVQQSLEGLGISTKNNGEWTVRQTPSGKWTVYNVWGEASGTFANKEAAQAKAAANTSRHNEGGAQYAYHQLGGNAAYPSLDKGQASAKLREAGIPGIKYLDQFSRTAGDGTRNYVVFDDKLVSIVRKYGLIGALTMGALSVDDAVEMKKQGLI